MALAILVSAADARAQSRSTPDSVPAGRGHHSIYYDATHGAVMLGGGATTGPRREIVYFNDLWRFDGAAWVSTQAPSDRLWGISLAFDAQQRLFSFGGSRDSAVGELRVIQDGAWRTVSRHPTVRATEPGFVFDAARNRFLVFGGQSDDRRIDPDLWEFDGTRWHRVTAPAPPPRSAHVMVYDARRHRTVVFGGMGPGPWRTAETLGDTWEYDGRAWTRVTSYGPPARMGAGATFDSRRGVVLVFGGTRADGQMLNDLWSWDGAAWKKLAENGPEPRVLGYIAYDVKRDRTVLFGGRPPSPSNIDFNDTWEWDGAVWRRVAAVTTRRP